MSSRNIFWIAIVTILSGVSFLIINKLKLKSDEENEKRQTISYME